MLLQRLRPNELLQIVDSLTPCLEALRDHVQAEPLSVVRAGGLLRRQGSEVCRGVVDAASTAASRFLRAQ